jgi:hypothetical protein
MVEQRALGGSWKAGENNEQARRRPRVIEKIDLAWKVDMRTKTIPTADMVKKANDEEEEAIGSNEKPVGPTIEEMKQKRKKILQKDLK